MKAIKITTDNEMSVVEVPEPHWEGMGELVGGNFEPVRAYGFMNLDVPNKESLLMVVNEEGQRLELDVNQVASELYNSNKPKFYWNIAGDILIMAEGFTNGEPDVVGLDDEQLIIVMIALKGKFDYPMEVIEDETN